MSKNKDYDEGLADGYALKRGWIINDFIKYLDSNVFELRHDMELIRRAADQYKESIYDSKKFD